jgi:hypothetical protein
MESNMNKKTEVVVLILYLYKLYTALKIIFSFPSSPRSSSGSTQFYY